MYVTYVDTFMMRRQEIRITDVPEDFLCPLCGVGKDQFSEVE